MIDITDIDKAKLVTHFFIYSLEHRARTRPGFFSLSNLTEEKRDAYLDSIKKKVQKELDKGMTYFDYLDGVGLHLDVSKDELDPTMYDRDNGTGAAEDAVHDLRRFESFARNVREALAHDRGEDITDTDDTSNTSELENPSRSWCVIL